MAWRYSHIITNLSPLSFSLRCINIHSEGYPTAERPWLSELLKPRVRQQQEQKTEHALLDFLLLGGALSCCYSNGLSLEMRLNGTEPPPPSRMSPSPLTPPIERVSLELIGEGEMIYVYLFEDMERGVGGYILLLYYYCLYLTRSLCI